MNKLFRVPATFLLLTAFVAACQKTIPTQVSDASNDGVVEFDGATYSFRVVNRVSVGGPDFCGATPGCDANFSLSARIYSDGSVRGQWNDTLNGRSDPAIPVHIAIDCLVVDGNDAWVSGLITTKEFAGIPVFARVRDNGTSANDPPDQISFQFEGETPCTARPNLALFDLDDGQVTIR